MKPKHDLLNTAKLREARMRAIKRRAIIFGSLFFVIFAVLVYVSRLRAFELDTITVTGNRVTEAAVIEEAVRAELAGMYFFVFPRDNFLLYPKDRIKSELREDFPRLLAVDISRKGRHELYIDVEEFQPVSLWCGMLPATETDSGNCLFLDTDGYAFSEAPRFSGDIYFKWYGDPAGDGLTLRERFLLQKEFDRLVRLKDALMSIARPVSLFADTEGGYTFYLLSGTEIRVRAQNDFDTILGNLTAALGVEPLKTAAANRFVDVLYIDLRYDNKVYYKIR